MFLGNGTTFTDKEGVKHTIISQDICLKKNTIYTLILKKDILLESKKDIPYDVRQFLEELANAKELSKDRMVSLPCQKLGDLPPIEDSIKEYFRLTGGEGNDKA